MPDQQRSRATGRTVLIALVAVVVAAALVLAIHPAVLQVAGFSSVGAGVGPAPTTVVQHDDGAAAAADASTLRVLPGDGSRYFGVSVAHVSDGADPSAEFTAAVGVAPTLQMFFESFSDTFDLTTARRILAAGRLPMVTWEPYDFHDPDADSYPLTDIAAGKFDSYLRSEAAAMASLPGAVVVRFAHEMNGDWYPWGVGVPGNSAADYVAAYRHVHDVVTAAGATNVVWTWSPNLVDADPSIKLAPLYPGDDYVDWVGLSGYYTNSTDTFSRRIDPTLDKIDKIAPNKPVILAETAVPSTGRRVAQIRELVREVAAEPRFAGLVWFDVSKRADWSVDDDPGAAAALGAAVRAGNFGAVPERVGG